MSKNITKWGKECKKRMIDKDVTLEALGKATGYTRTYVSAIINGRMIAPDSTVTKISNELGVDSKLILAEQECK